MAYRYGNRYQTKLLPESIDEYVSADDPVRAYDAFIDTIDLKKIGIELNPNKVGNSEYNPKSMLKLLVYGYSYGWKGSRKLERAVYHNISFIWITEGLKPDHKTISEFRRRNRKAIKELLKQCARLCIKLGLIDGNVLFVDGTKIRANATRGKNYTKEHYKKQLAKLDKRIDKLLDECDRIDEEESEKESFVKMKKELANNKTLRNKIKDILEQFKEEETQSKKTLKTINQTDSDSSLMKSIQGSHASYNVQSVVDDKHGLIVHTDAVKDTNDFNQFANQITQAEEVLEKRCKIASADAGYADTEELEKVLEQGTKVIVPTQRQALKSKEKPFSKSSFTYNKEQNCYYCKEGQKLDFKGKQDKGKLAYRITDGSICRKCKNYGICTQAKKGRKIVRLEKEEVKERLEQEYEQDGSQGIYARRKEKVEHPFGHIKQNLQMKNFLLRGREGVQAETSIVATCFNIARMLTIFGGVKKLIAHIDKLQTNSYCDSLLLEQS